MSTITKRLRVDVALLETGWAKDVVFSIDAQGDLVAISSGKDEQVDEHYQAIALPGMVNAHSHAFQRGFAGESEFRSASQDSFWTWRQRMYEYALSLTPEAVYEVARRLYQEMLTAGYTWVGEFHYLHRDPQGNRYGDSAAMSQTLLMAAQDTGIGICLLPVLYQRGGFQNEPLNEGQRRFYLSDEEYLDLVEQLRSSSVSRSPNCRLGLALHSLRAVDSKIGNRIIGEARQADPTIPIHIHVAEQTAEVEACLATHGRRPLEYLFENYDVDRHWCLIHATHSLPNELQAIVRANAVVGLCPTTEANLGDGIFPAAEFFGLQGRLAIGSDSHISIDVREELRWLEYGQRLRLHQRNVLSTEEASTGRSLYERCSHGGGQAIGVKTGRLAVGYRADLVLLQATHPQVFNATGDAILDRYLFCQHPGSSTCLQRVMVGGKWVFLQEPR